jgi:hypothetical protein
MVKKDSMPGSYMSSLKRGSITVYSYTTDRTLSTLPADTLSQRLLSFHLIEEKGIPQAAASSRQAGAMKTTRGISGVLQLSTCAATTAVKLLPGRVVHRVPFESEATFCPDMFRGSEADRQSFCELSLACVCCSRLNEVKVSRP